MPSGSCDTHDYRRHILLRKLSGKPGESDGGDSCHGGFCGWNAGAYISQYGGRMAEGGGINGGDCISEN